MNESLVLPFSITIQWKGERVLKEERKQARPRQSTTKGSSAARPPSSHGQRNNNYVSSSVNTSKQSVKTLSKPSIAKAAYEEQITELKLSVDSLEKERDFYFSKLRDIEILLILKTHRLLQLSTGFYMLQMMMVMYQKKNPVQKRRRGKTF